MSGPTALPGEIIFTRPDAQNATPTGSPQTSPDFQKLLTNNKPLRMEPHDIPKVHQGVLPPPPSISNSPILESSNAAGELTNPLSPLALPPLRFTNYSGPTLPPIGNLIKAPGPATQQEPVIAPTP